MILDQIDPGLVMIPISIAGFHNLAAFLPKF